MFWIIYLLSAVLLSMMLSRLSKKNSFELFVICLVIFVTPSQVDMQSLNYSPSIFTFIFNLILERDLSTRVLRPLLLSLSLSLIFLLLYRVIKTKFF